MPKTPAPGGGADAYRARKTRKLGVARQISTGLGKLALKTPKTGNRTAPLAPPAGGGTRKPLPSAQRKMKMKQTLPVPPVAGQKTANGKVKMYATRSKQVRARGVYFKKRGKNY